MYGLEFKIHWLVNDMPPQKGIFEGIQAESQYTLLVYDTRTTILRPPSHYRSSIKF